jgi:GTP-binding protein
LKDRNQGDEGEKKEFEFKLKLIADVGFIGFPNSGKSTLLASVIHLNLTLFSYSDY